MQQPFSSAPESHGGATPPTGFSAELRHRQAFLLLTLMDGEFSVRAGGEEGGDCLWVHQVTRRGKDMCVTAYVVT